MLIGGVMMIMGVIQAWGLSGYGDGSAENPYQVRSVDDLHDIRNLLDKHYRLMFDLDVSVKGNWEPIGTAGGPFTGTFDGNNKTIRGLYINRPEESGVGLFGYISNAEIDALTIESSGVTGKNPVGILVGRSVGSLIRNCHVKGTVTGEGSVGGLIGYTEYGSAYWSIEGCSADVTVTGTGGNVGGLIGCHSYGNIKKGCHASGTVSGTEYVGGLVGLNYGGIYESYATGSVICTEATGVSTSGQRAGGLVGGNNGTVYQCYATASVEGVEFLGGLVGWNDKYDEYYGAGLVDECYAAGRVEGVTNTGGLIGRNEGKVVKSVFDRETTEQTEGIGWSDSGSEDECQARTTTQMLDQTLYLYWDWDFTNTWAMLPGGSYPYLRRYQNAPVIYPPSESKPIDTVITITSQPLSLPLVYGESGALHVSASVVPADVTLSYKWYRTMNGVTTELSDATGNTYTLPDLKAGTYYYHCVISAGTKPAPTTPALVLVNKAPLHVRVCDTSRVYGDPNPVSYRLIYEGFVLPDTPDSLTSPPVPLCSATQDDNAGKYTISVSGGRSENYTFTYGYGTLNILRASLDSSNFRIDTTSRLMQVVPTAGTVGEGNVLRTYYDDEVTPPDTAGTYSITIDVSGGTNYKDTTGLFVGTYTIPETGGEDDGDGDDDGGDGDGGDDDGDGDGGDGGDDGDGDGDGDGDDELSGEEPVKPKPDPDPVKPKPVDPVPVDPSDPVPVDPSDPVPSDPVPVEPDPDVISVWIPSISGISTLPSPGRYPVTPGTTFTLTVQTTTSLPVIVTTSRPDASLLHIVPTTPTSLTVHILDVRESLTVSFRLDPLSSTGTEPSPRVWTTQGYLHTESLLPQLVQIYTTSGQLVSMFPLLGTINTKLPKGLYIVSTGNQQHKVFVR
jgi:hypothetical protein